MPLADTLVTSERRARSLGNADHPANCAAARTLSTTLTLAAVASGAFGAFLLRRVTLEDVARISVEPLVELARFVDQVNPDVLQQILSMLA
jgi:hypothetical protein